MLSQASKRQNHTLPTIHKVCQAPSCQSIPTPLTELEKEQIKEEVKKAFETSTAAVNDHDAFKIMQSFWNDKNNLYAANGTLTKGWERNNEISTTIHSDPKNKAFTIDYDEIIIKVIK